MGLVAYFGEGRFRGIYVASSVIGMLALIGGKAIAGYVEVWVPPIWGGRLAALLMLMACMLFPAMAFPSNIKRVTRHPMLWGVACWSGAHCLANGDLASIILFGGFGVFALYEMWSLNARGAQKSDAVSPIRNDVCVIIAGLALYGALIGLHPYLFGVSVIRMG